MEACGIVPENTYFTLGDGDKSLIIDGDGDEDYGAPLTDTVCVLDALDVTDAVLEKMNSTSALMGVVSASWNGITAEWTYHPDNGFDIILTVE